jgi:hypothetical protein
MTAPTPAVRGRPCAARTPEPGVHGHIADDGSPGTRLETHKRRSVA